MSKEQLRSENQDSQKVQVVKKGVNPFDVNTSNCVFCNPVKEA